MNRPLTHQELKDWANKTWSEIMTKEDSILMARECGIPSDELYHPNLERFAALVAAAEREACARVASNAHWPDASNYPIHIAVAIRARGETK